MYAVDEALFTLISTCCITNLIFLLSHMDSTHISVIKTCVNLLTVNACSVHLYQQITCY